MKPRRNLRKAAKWTGAAVCALLIGAIGASQVWSVTYWGGSAGVQSSAGLGTKFYVVDLRSGALGVGWGEHHESPFASPSLVVDVGQGWKVLRRRAVAPSWRVRREDTLIRRSTVARLPLWIPLVVVAAPTFFLFRADWRTAQREKAGKCPNCNYPLTGLPLTTPCPECGAAPAPSAPKKTGQARCTEISENAIIGPSRSLRDPGAACTKPP